MSNRVVLPSEFFDITSAHMLVTPLPEFTYAKMLFASDSRAQLMKSDATAFLASMQRGPRTAGAPAPDVGDMQLQLAKSIISKAIVSVPELGQKGVGHTVRINRPIFSGGGYTLEARRVAASQTISTTPITMSGEQTSITIQRNAGPYAASGSAVQPYPIDRLDAGRSVHELAGIVSMHLSYDRWKFLDSVVSTLFNSASTYVQRSGNLSADSSFPGAGAEQPMDLETLFRAEELLKNAGIPRFEDGTYAVILSPRQMRQLRLDPDFSRQSVFLPEQNVLQNSTVVRVGETLNIMESSTVPTDTATVSGQTIYRGVMFGPGAVGYGLDDACRVANSTDDNYGETAKVIWIAYEGFTVLDERFMCSLRSC